MLLGTVGFGAWQYTENQRLIRENDSLRQQLDATASQLQQAQQEHDRLRSELNQTRTRAAQLEGKITELEANITALREELEDKALRTGAITIGLTFLWNPELPLEVMRLLQVVKYINHDFWAPLSIYFFMYHARPEVWIPLTYKCDADWGWTWSNHATRLYPERDIPVGLFQQGLDSVGCVWNHRVMAIDAARTGLLRSAEVWGTNPFNALGGPIIGLILVHELLHAVGGITDEEIDRKPGSDVTIPLEWFSRIQAAAKWFQMTPPDEAS